MLTYQWSKLSNGVYAPLKQLDLTRVAGLLGIYTIFHTEAVPHAVRVGQGLIGQRLDAHRSDPEILAYEAFGTLIATWIIPPAAYLNGIERFLGDALQPYVGDRFPDAAPIAVNLP